MGHVVRLDTDGDGRISRTEAAAQPRLAERFDQADGNRDGYLVRSELRASAEKHRAESMARHRERFEAKFTQADSNRDGKLSRAEVEAGMPHLAKAFAFHDEDRDGFLTRADLQPRRAAEPTVRRGPAAGAPNQEDSLTRAGDLRGTGLLSGRRQKRPASASASQPGQRGLPS